MREGRHCRREGITINIFLLPTWSQSREDVQFAYRLAESTAGRVFFTAGRDLDPLRRLGLPEPPPRDRRLDAGGRARGDFFRHIRVFHQHPSGVQSAPPEPRDVSPCFRRVCGIIYRVDRFPPLSGYDPTIPAGLGGSYWHDTV